MVYTKKGSDITPILQRTLSSKDNLSGWKKAGEAALTEQDYIDKAMVLKFDATDTAEQLRFTDHVVNLFYPKWMEDLSRSQPRSALELLNATQVQLEPLVQQWQSEGSQSHWEEKLQQKSVEYLQLVKQGFNLQLIAAIESKSGETSMRVQMIKAIQHNSFQMLCHFCIFGLLAAELLPEDDPTKMGLDISFGVILSLDSFGMTLGEWCHGPANADSLLYWQLNAGVIDALAWSTCCRQSSFAVSG